MKNKKNSFYHYINTLEIAQRNLYTNQFLFPKVKYMNIELHYTEPIVVHEHFQKAQVLLLFNAILNEPANVVVKPIRQKRGKYSFCCFIKTLLIGNAASYALLKRLLYRLNKSSFQKKLKIGYYSSDGIEKSVFYFNIPVSVLIEIFDINYLAKHNSTDLYFKFGVYFDNYISTDDFLNVFLTPCV